MKVSKAWLQNFFDEPLPDTEALCDALTFHVFEIDGTDKVGDDPSRQGEAEADTILDVKVTPNRGHDCLSHRGIAKELSAILKRPLVKDPFARTIDLSKKSENVTVSIQTPLCKRYIAGEIKGVKVGPSPEWLRKSIEAIGQRSINNVVDATNMVMFNVGQPLHAFDAAKLGSLSMGVRMAHEGEKLLALDQKEYTLLSSMMVITAGDTAVGVAGVKGGMPAAIDESTTHIVIESASFDGVSVRKTAQALKLRTDASVRFEQGISSELAAVGMQQVVDLILSIAGGEVEGFVDVYPTPEAPSRASVTVEHINRVLGTTFTAAEVADVFSRLGFAYKEENGLFEVIAPFERLDIVIPEDLIEEVGRIIGYDAIPAASLPAFSGTPTINTSFAAAEKVREEWMAQGYSEVYTSVFADKGERVVLNKVDGVRPYLRESLVPGLTEALQKNKPNKDLLGLSEIKLFEVGTVWKEGKEVMMVGVATEKSGVTEKVLEPLEVNEYEALPISTAERYKSFSRYPYMVRDVAVWVPAETDAEALRHTLKAEAGDLAVEVRLFDRFEKEGKVSLAFRIIFQSFERTLTEAEVTERMAAIAAMLTTKGFEIR